MAAFFLPREKVMSILKEATGATRRAAVASFMVKFVVCWARRKVGTTGLTEKNSTTRT